MEGGLQQSLAVLVPISLGPLLQSQDSPAFTHSTPHDTDNIICNEHKTQNLGKLSTGVDLNVSTELLILSCIHLFCILPVTIYMDLWRPKKLCYLIIKNCVVLPKLQIYCHSFKSSSSNPSLI